LASAPARLTPAQAEAFHRDGFLVVKGALDAEAIARWRQVCRDIAAGERARRGLGEADFAETRHAIHQDHRLLDLITWPTTFPLVAELMGPDISLVTTHNLVRPVQPAGTSKAFKSSGWHRDAHSNLAPVHWTCPWIYTKI